jgi:SsrA-binding protein
MSKAKKKAGLGDNVIANNRRAKHDYSIESTFQAGLVLEGWEVKAMRAGKCTLVESYVQIHKNEAWLNGSNISPLLSASSHVVPNQTRNRKLLLNRHELERLMSAVSRKGFTIVPLKLYFFKNRVKLDIGLAKGKKLHDKRASAKELDWNRDKSRIMKNVNR